MNKIFSSAQIRALDRHAIEDLGIPVLVLMENAGRAVAEASRELAQRCKAKKIFVLCGGGNNGGDGVVAARYLHGWGFKVRVIWLKNPEHWKGDTGRHHQMAKKAGVSFKSFESLGPAPEKVLRKADLLIDALLGTGTTGALREPYLSVIQAMNASRQPIVAVDIPSGLDSDTGKSLGAVIKATVTVTMAVAKKGLLAKSAKAFVGQLRIADIGIPAQSF